MPAAVIWDLVAPEFSPRERWGRPDRVSGLLLLALHAVRRTLGWPMVIHCAVETEGHSPTGEHPPGRAVDFHFAAPGVPYREQVERLEEVLDALQLSDFVGLGIYPDWAHPGFHLDVRGRRARWGRIGSRYVSLEEALARA
ncbi:hypothetical protein G3N55_00010 [Dissulfurirhabdus thermomarina]|uniref:Peptidase M15A C-terminal domain-containing protein n=1 Tax=Dissulfurirhabdus thermomarina TaxID=1765737 RepID=A0A6N9TMD5_DISTH|nr:hypothetical protein [Dissulfurirhabdus thermomarina]NDY41233.1 hypothetical protein [Dissulfurirhabdus thermomarina]